MDGDVVGTTGGVSRRLPFGMIDAAALAMIVLIGGLHLLLFQRSNDFFYDDVFVGDCARSLLHDGYYGIAGRIETNQPPGTAAMLAVVCFLGGCSHVVYLQVMAVCETLGFVACYGLLRRNIGRVAAATICLLLISAPVYFSLATQWVTPCFPYFLLLMSALLVMEKFEEGPSGKARWAWGALLAILVVASTLTATAGAALVAAMLVAVAAEFAKDRRAGVARMKAFAGIVLVAVLAQGLWMHRKGQPLEWNVPGYPRPYLEQLKVKNGNYPESGMAGPLDVAKRVAGNTYEHSYLLSQILIRKWINPSWPSLLISGPGLLILLGWGYSLWQSGGRGPLEWFFAVHEGIYLLWPWNMEARFFLPVAPLACLYLWRGGEGVLFLLRNRPRILGGLLLPACGVLSAAMWAQLRGSGVGAQLVKPGLQGWASLGIWLILAISAAWMIARSGHVKGIVFRVSEWLCTGGDARRIGPLMLLRAGAAALAIVLIGAGLRQQMEIGRSNLDKQLVGALVTPEVHAGEWIENHTEASAVVMARYLPTVYHYAQRKMVWFPPSSDAKLLMDGIQRLGVNYVVVTRHAQNYYLPPDPECFTRLAAAYPAAFVKVAEGQDFWVYRVVAS